MSVEKGTTSSGKPIVLLQTLSMQLPALQPKASVFFSRTGPTQTSLYVK